MATPDAEQNRDEHQDGEPQGQAQIADGEDPGNIGAGRIKRAMGEVEGAGRAIDQRQADRDDAVGGRLGDAAEDYLEELGHRRSAMAITTRAPPPEMTPSSSR